MMPSINSKAERLDARLHYAATPIMQSASSGLLVVWAMFALLLLAGCGQKGPLHRPAPVAAPAAMAQAF